MGMDPSEKLGMGGIMFAGGFSAVPATLLMTPMERIKVMLQVSALLLLLSITAVTLIRIHFLLYHSIIHVLTL
jgi:hypothetical protein